MSFDKGKRAAQTVAKLRNLDFNSGGAQELDSSIHSGWSGGTPFGHRTAIPCVLLNN